VGHQDETAFVAATVLECLCCHGLAVSVVSVVVVIVVVIGATARRRLPTVQSLQTALASSKIGRMRLAARSIPSCRSCRQLMARVVKYVLFQRTSAFERPRIAWHELSCCDVIASTEA
jgi:hypothetical protein